MSWKAVIEVWEGSSRMISSCLESYNGQGTRALFWHKPGKEWKEYTI